VNDPFEQECADVDSLLTRLGLDPTRCRSEGGRLLVGRAVNMLRERAVNRFLACPLPESVCSDACATMRGYPHRIGTNLLTAEEAGTVLAHVLGPDVSPKDSAK
jgi:hypothetical protein